MLFSLTKNTAIGTSRFIPLLQKKSSLTDLGQPAFERSGACFMKTELLIRSDIFISGFFRDVSEYIPLIIFLTERACDDIGFPKTFSEVLFASSSFFPYATVSITLFSSPAFISTGNFSAAHNAP